MPLATNLIRTYTSHAAYEQDAAILAKLGYVVASVIEEPGPRGWARNLRGLFGSALLRLIVTYSDQGLATSR